ncbi:MAG TPA: hypothetical protein VGR81_08270 [Candidatus Acidoferrales bacterium]|nr:hypothetical protein [Candidatus Acidoferrales bacterium]
MSTQLAEKIFSAAVLLTAVVTSTAIAAGLEWLCLRTMMILMPAKLAARDEIRIPVRAKS